MRYLGFIAIIAVASAGNAAAPVPTNFGTGSATLGASVEVPAEGRQTPSLQLRGVFFFNGVFHFNVIDAGGRSSGWVKLKDDALGYLVTDFDQTTETITLSGEPGREPIRLRLVDSKVSESSPTELPSPSTTGAPPPLPPAVRAMMFPASDALRAPRLAHPCEAAALAVSAASLPPEVERYFPVSPGPSWKSAIVGSRLRCGRLSAYAVPFSSVTIATIVVVTIEISYWLPSRRHQGDAGQPFTQLSPIR